jgi:branched-chain amino acid transport system substrate-binding protein
MAEVKKFLFLFFTCLLLVALVLPACAAPKEENVIKVGVVGPMQFIQGEHHWAGATMAAEEINDAGGVKIGDKNYKIQLVKVDSNELLDVAGAASAVERAITVDKVDFLIGGFRTEAVYPMSDVAMDYKKIFLNCGAATAALQKRVADDYDTYKYFFKITPYNEVFLVTSDFKMLAMVAEILKQDFGITKPRVAIIAEKLEWAEAMVALAEARLPSMGMEVVGTWRPSDTATDVTAELTAIAAKEPHIIFTTFSGPVGITYAKQRGELKIPVVSVGINVEAQKSGFWEATGGKGNYEFVLNTYAKGVAMTDKTIPFFDEFERRTGEFPTYTAATYDALLSMKANIEKAGTLDADALVPVIEQSIFSGTAGTTKYYPLDSPACPPMCPHDIVYGPGYQTGVGTQWQDGQLKGVWPKKEYGAVDTFGDWRFEYPGTVALKIAPEAADKFKAAPAAPPAAPPPPPPPGGLSFEAAEYTNADLGFSVKYPKNWKENKDEEKAPSVFYAADPARAPTIRVAVVEAATFADAVKAGLEKAGASGIKVGAEKEITLADGTTKATGAKVDLKSKGYDAEAYALGVKKGDKWVTVVISTVALLVPYDEAKQSEIAKTLTFK